SPYVQREYGELCITASNLRIEAKEGAEVLVCVRDPYEAVLYFANSQNVVLHGLTVGHDVEPGYCSGSVLRYSSVSGVTIENCKLYGCGTYGVEAEYCYNMQVNDTEIYECTYGLLSLNSVSDAVFQNCEMRDSGDLTVFYLPSCYGIVFEDCDIHDNRSTENYNGQFVELDTEYGDVTFWKCRFNNNTYRKFSDYSVTLDQCTVKDNVK
ncbi:MAG: right-handed parallel beta-helix repeat-containing protein, partial [Lachnospiraceae bacterium]|nr:right-handed parallel beta-helix repeat-containing protein [Lachnospiraceae bacterium]